MLSPTLERLALLAEVATPGPWIRKGAVVWGTNPASPSDLTVVTLVPVLARDSDLDYIAAANPAIIQTMLRQLRGA